MKSVEALAPWKILTVARPEIGLKGWLVIDQNIYGYATGGVRMRPGTTVDEVANLAREMTLKFQLLNMETDGAKAGIDAPPNLTPDERIKLLHAFGAALKEPLLAKTYIPGEDMGVGPHDLAELLAGAGIEATAKQTPGEYYAALTAEICLEQWLKATRTAPEEATVTIEGYGKVGRHAARLAARLRTRVTGISTALGAIWSAVGLDVERLETLQDKYGDAVVEHYDGAQRLPRELLAEQAATVFMPGAQPMSVHAGNVDRLKAGAVIAIANVASDEAGEARMHERGIDFFPGFMANCGGVLGYYLRGQGFPLEALEPIIRDGFGRKVAGLIERARREKIGVAAAARQLCAEHHASRTAPRGRSLARLSDWRRLAWFLWRTGRVGPLKRALDPFARRYMADHLAI